MTRFKIAICAVALLGGAGALIASSTSVGREGPPSPQEAFGLLRGGPATHDGRLATTRGDERFFVREEGDRVCLMYQNSQLAGNSCASGAEAVSADRPLTLVIPQYPRGRLTRQVVAVLMRDGVQSVRVTEKDGRSIDVPVENNVAAYIGERPAEVAWTVDGEHHVNRGVLMPLQPPH